MRKAEYFAIKLGDSDFKVNAGWLDRFKTGDRIDCRSVCGESGVIQVDTDKVHVRKNNKLPQLIKGYKLCDIFNADETGLFYKLMPEKTIQLKGEKCSGGKRSKDRLTLLVASNMDGSEKIKF